MKRRALFIGVNEYEDPQIRDLNYSLSDAHALKTLFELFGYQTDILENPAKSDVFSTIRKMTSDLAAGDLFFFYFAGHGWTTTTGKHLLFCSDDMYEDLRYEYNVGIPFDILKKRTEAGGYNRAFVLDACRSDFITGTRGDDATTRDLRPIGELVKDAPTKSSLAVLRSCSKYEHALEIESRKHGLFTLAMMDVLRSSKESGAELLFGESLCDAVTQKMTVIACAEGIVAAQTPEFAKSGAAQVLISGRKAPPDFDSSAAAPVLVVCPVCGKKNHPENTFKCRKCGRDNLCLRHQDEKTFLCTNCADAQRTAQKVEAPSGTVRHSRSQTQSVSARDAYEKGENFYYGRNGFAQSYADAVSWYRLAAEQGHAMAQSDLGFMYEKGRGVGQDYGEAVKWYRKAAEQGDADAQNRLGDCYYCGRGIGKNFQEAVRWYRKAGDQGNAEAQYNMGYCYHNGRIGGCTDYVEAAKWYHEAALKGHVNAQYMLGFCYKYGEGVNQDYVEAAKWYRKAAEQGYEKAKWALDELKTKGLI